MLGVCLSFLCLADVCVCDYREGWWGGWLQQSFQAVKDKVITLKNKGHHNIIEVSLTAAQRLLMFIKAILPLLCLDLSRNI